MSNAIFPSLPGLTWGATKVPKFSTKVQRATSGREVRTAYMAYPLWQYDLSYEFLRNGNAGTDLQTLMGFFLARQGQFDNFLFTDPTDNAVTAQGFGTGDGTTAAFQLVRAFGGFVEPVQNLNGAPSIYVGGVLKTAGTDYTVSSTGLVTFTIAPAAAAALTWAGSYYMRCRFLADEAEFSQFMKDLWELKKLQMIGSPINKV